MKAVISITFDHNYIWFLPLTTWCWNKLGVGVECFSPKIAEDGCLLPNPRMVTAIECIVNNKMDFRLNEFCAPKHKEATYAQCSRLYAAALDLPEDEILVTSDADMAIFKLPPSDPAKPNQLPVIFGWDLTPDSQYPMCYCSAIVKHWRHFMQIKNKSYQECLDEILSPIEADNFRGNYWSKDQEVLFNQLRRAHLDYGNGFGHMKVDRARPGTQFASNRYDRDDQFILDRLSPDTIDFHMPRPGYTEENFNIILKILQYHYPNEDFDWLINYRNEYITLL